jgi:hypothetical protein
MFYTKKVEKLAKNNLAVFWLSMYRKSDLRLFSMQI